MCPYDGSQLAAGVLADVELTHPVVIVAGRCRPGYGYLGPGRVPPGCDEPLPAAPPGAAVMTFAGDPGVVRDFAVRHAESAGLPVPRVADLMLAAGELAATRRRFPWRRHRVGLVHCG